MRGNLRIKTLIIAAVFISGCFLLYFVIIRFHRENKIDSSLLSTKYFQVSVPTNWIVEGIKTINSQPDSVIRTVDAIVISLPFDSESDTYSENITFELKRISREMDLGAIKKRVVNQMFSQVQDVMIRSEGKGMLTGYESVWFVVSYKLNDDCILSRFQLVGICDTLAYIIISNARCQEFDEYYAIFDSVQASFRNLADCNVGK